MRKEQARKLKKKFDELVEKYLPDDSHLQFLILWRKGYPWMMVLTMMIMTRMKPLRRDLALQVLQTAKRKQMVTQRRCLEATAMAT